MHARRLFAYLMALAPILALILLASNSLPLALAETQAFAPAAAGLPAGQAARAGQTTYTDPFAYCAAVKTIDAPDARYKGPPVPDVIAGALQAATAMPNEVLPAGQPDATYYQHSVWRCLGGKVYACYAGSSTPCTQKADNSRQPLPAMKTFCAANPNNPTIPASITGLRTTFQWKCAKGVPQVLKQYAKADSRGFVEHLWTVVQPQP